MNINLAKKFLLSLFFFSRRRHVCSSGSLYPRQGGGAAAGLLPGITDLILPHPGVLPTERQNHTGHLR